MLSQAQLEQFVRLWQERSVSEVATAMGMTVQQASALAHRLRKRGVPLRDQRHSRCDDHIDYEALRRVAQSANVNERNE